MPKLILDEVRKKKGVSKRQLAIRLGVRYQNIFPMMKPDYDAKFSVLARIAKALGCRVRDLVREK